MRSSPFRAIRNGGKWGFWWATPTNYYRPGLYFKGWRIWPVRPRA